MIVQSTELSQRVKQSVLATLKRDELVCNSVTLGDLERRIQRLHKVFKYALLSQERPFKKILENTLKKYYRIRIFTFSIVYLL